MIQIQFRRDTPFRWEALNPVLADGEPGVELGSKRFKIGDGISRWNELTYAISFDGQAEIAKRRYVHEQGTAVMVWSISHNLGAIPAAVAVIDSANNVVHGGVVHLSVNDFELHFSAPFSGKAIVTA